MSVFRIGLASEFLGPGHVQVGPSTAWAPVHRQSVPLVLKLQTRAYFHAAAHHTGLKTAYMLDKVCAGADPHGRYTRIFYGWSTEGSPAINRVRKKGTPPGVLARLSAVRKLTPIPDRVLAMSMWQQLDAAPKQLQDAQRLPTDAGDYPGTLYNEGLTWQTQTPGLWAKVVADLQRSDTRYPALNGLFHLMRRSTSLREMPTYIAAYLAWLKARPAMRADPVFGPIAIELYDYTAYYFSRLVVEPFDEAGLKFLSSCLTRHGIEFRFEETRGFFEVPLQDIPNTEPARKLRDLRRAAIFERPQRPDIPRRGVPRVL